jgi:hypothetical protein
VIGLKTVADTTVTDQEHFYLPMCDGLQTARASFFSGLKSDLSYLEGEQIKTSFHIASCSISSLTDLPESFGESL